MQQVIRTVIPVGLEKPVKLLHITDVHITRCAESDPDYQKELATLRVEIFREEGNDPPHTPEEYLAEAFALAEKEGAIPVVTGDVMDIHTQGNVEYFRRFIEDKDLLFTPGGHEYQRVCVRTMEEGEAYVSTVKTELRAQFPRFDWDFSSRVIGGVNIVLANNALDYYNAYTVERFEKELDKGLPIIVFSHDPIKDRLLNRTENYHKNIHLTEKDYEISHRMLRALRQDPRVVTTIAGHWHRSEEYEVDGKKHYITDGLFKGVCRLIEII